MVGLVLAATITTVVMLPVYGMLGIADFVLYALNALWLGNLVLTVLAVYVFVRFEQVCTEAITGWRPSLVLLLTTGLAVGVPVELVVGDLAAPSLIVAVLLGFELRLVVALLQALLLRSYAGKSK